MSYFILMPMSLIMTFISFFVSPLAAALADKEGNPPKWLRWFGTYDNSLYGDNGWQTEHCPAYRSWWCMTKWMWRNPIGVFGHEVAGKTPNLGNLKIKGNPYVSNRPLTPGYLWVSCKNCWMLYVVVAWPGRKRCIRLVLGWKLAYVAQRQEIRGAEQIVLAFNPLASVSEVV